VGVRRFGASKLKPPCSASFSRSSLRLLFKRSEAAHSSEIDGDGRRRGSAACSASGKFGRQPRRAELPTMVDYSKFHNIGDEDAPPPPPPPPEQQRTIGAVGEHTEEELREQLKECDRTAKRGDLASAAGVGVLRGSARPRRLPAQVRVHALGAAAPAPRGRGHARRGRGVHAPGEAAPRPGRGGPRGGEQVLWQEEVRRGHQVLLRVAQGRAAGRAAASGFENPIRFRGGSEACVRGFCREERGSERGSKKAAPRRARVEDNT